MIKTLQKKFIVTAMTAVTALLLILLGTINLVNLVMVGKEVEQTLVMLSEAEGDFGHVPMQQRAVPPPDFRIAPKAERDKFLSSNFFVVRLNDAGKVVFTDVSRTASVDETSAGTFAQKALAGQKSTGKMGKYRYRISRSRAGNETVAVFLDHSEEMLSYVRVLVLSFGIGAVCWGLMLALIVFLSKRAIRPIAENIEKQKQFVTNAGHEIKTPLAIILANAEAMELYQGENKWTKNIKAQTIRLDGLMKHLLLLAKMEEGAGAEKRTTQAIRLDTLLNEQIEIFAEPLKLRDITLQTEIAPDVLVKADKEQMTQMLSILFDNALKYTNEGGWIYVGLQKYGKHIRLQMKNTCEKLPDMPPEQLFDRFCRDDRARTQKMGGYGIGLSAARLAAEANGGRMTAEYEEGTVVSFIVRMP